MKTLSHASTEEKTKRLEDFKISHIYWSFSSDNMALLGLKLIDLREFPLA